MFMAYKVAKTCLWVMYFKALPPTLSAKTHLPPESQKPGGALSVQE